MIFNRRIIWVVHSPGLTCRHIPARAHAHTKHTYMHLHSLHKNCGVVPFFLTAHFLVLWLFSGYKILELLQKSEDDWNEDDVQHASRVVCEPLHFSFLGGLL